MENKRGCLKNSLFGCLGLVVVGVVLVGIAAIVARRGIEKADVRDHSLALAEQETATLPTDRGGRLILELGQGEFEIKPARPGETLHVEARFDQQSHELIDRFEVLPDSAWVYHLRYRRTIPALQALLQALMGGGGESRIEIFIPEDLPVALEVRVKEGGVEADLGGLWITDADIEYSKGGFALEIDEPLREPMEALRIHGSMGGFAAVGLGNASPRRLDVDCRMGGADIDLGGDWRRDCDIRLKVRMGGMDVRAPADVAVEGITATEGGGELRRADREIPLPVLRFDLDESMGEIEISQ